MRNSSQVSVTCWSSLVQGCPTSDKSHAGLQEGLRDSRDPRCAGQPCRKQRIIPVKDNDRLLQQPLRLAVNGADIVEAFLQNIKRTAWKRHIAGTHARQERSEKSKRIVLRRQQFGWCRTIPGSTLPQQEVCEAPARRIPSNLPHDATLTPFVLDVCGRGASKTECRGVAAEPTANRLCACAACVQHALSTKIRPSGTTQRPSK